MMFFVWCKFFVSRCASSNCTRITGDEKGTNQGTLWSQKFGTVKITFHSERWSLVPFFLFVCYCRDIPQWAMASSFTRFLDHTQRRTTVVRTPLDEWSDRRRDLYLITHNTHNRQTSMPPVGFEPTTPAGQRPQTCALDCAATGTGVPSLPYRT